MSKDSVSQNIARVSILVILIKLVGFVKQSVIAAYYGASIETDIIFTSTGFISSLALVAFSVLEINLVPIYSKKRLYCNNNEINEYFSDAISVFSVVAFILTVLIIIFAPSFAAILDVSLNADKQVILVKQIRLLALLIFPICLTKIFTAVLLAEQKFSAEKVSGFLMSAIIILATIIFSPKYGATALLLGYVVYFIANCVYVIAFGSKYINYVFHHSFRKNLPEIGKLILLLFPMVIGNGISEINSIIDKAIISSLGNGMISALYYGRVLHDFFSTTLLNSICAVLFSSFTHRIVTGNICALEAEVMQALKFSIFFLLPISIYVIVFASDISEIAYLRGNFDHEAAYYTSLIIIGYAIGFVAEAFRAICTRVCYGFADTKGPMIFGIFSGITNIILSLFLVKRAGVLGVSVASSIACMFAAIFLFRYVKKYVPHISIGKIKKNVAKNILATAFSGSASFFCVKMISNTIVHFLFGSILFIIFFVVLHMLLRSEEMAKCLLFFRRKAHVK